MVTARIGTLKRRYFARVQFKVWTAKLGEQLELMSEQYQLNDLTDCFNLLQDLEVGGYRVHEVRIVRTVSFNIEKVRRRADK